MVTRFGRLDLVSVELRPRILKILAIKLRKGRYDYDYLLALFFPLSRNSATAAASRELMRESRSRTRKASTWKTSTSL